MSRSLRLTGLAALATALAALSLAPAFEAGPWLWQVLACVLVVAAVGAAARLAGTPVWLVQATQLVGLLVWLTALYAHDDAVLWVLPGPGALGSLAGLFGDGMHTLWTQAAPVAPTKETVFLAALGVGYVATTVDYFAVTTRRPALAGVPLFLLYLVPASVVPGGVPWPLFVVGAAGWLLLIVGVQRDRLTRWGRPLAPSGQPAAEAATVSLSLGARSRRLGTLAVAAAVAVPLLVPGVASGVIGRGLLAGDHPGAATSDSARAAATLSPFVSLRRNLVDSPDTPVLTYRTDDGSPVYLRVTTLDRFDGTTWLPAAATASSSQTVQGGFGRPPGLGPGIATQTLVTQVAIGSLRQDRLPLPYPPTRVDIAGDWRWDKVTLDAFSAQRGLDTQGQRYTVTSLVVQPTVRQLRKAPPAHSDLAPSPDLAPYLALPTGLPALLTQSLSQAIAGVGDDAYDQAAAIQRYFQTQFTYSTRAAAGSGTDALTAFLRDRTGYCEQFAATMTVMARVLGIPARVVVGFAPGTLQPDGSYLVSLHDAHAWPELWFSGIGWVRFEPTPGGQGGDGVSAPVWTSGGTSGGSQGGTSGGGSAGQPVPGDRRGIDRDFGGRKFSRQPLSDLVVPGSGPSATPRRLAVGAGVLLAGLLVLPMVVAPVARARRRRAAVDPRAAATAGWSEVLERAEDLGLRPDGPETLRDTAGRLAGALGGDPDALASLDELRSAAEQVRFAPAGRELRGGATREGLAEATAVVTRALRAAAPTTARWRAVVLPASGVRRLRGATAAVGRRVGQASDAVTVWASRLGRRSRTA